MEELWGLLIRGHISMFPQTFAHTKQINWLIKLTLVQTIHSPDFGSSSVPTMKKSFHPKIKFVSFTCFIIECREMVGKLNSCSIMVRIWQFLRKNKEKSHSCSSFKDIKYISLHLFNNRWRRISSLCIKSSLSSYYATNCNRIHQNCRLKNHGVE